MLSHVTSPLIVAPSLSGMSLTPSCVTVTSAETSAVLPVKVIRVLRPRPSLAGTVKVWTAICGETVFTGSAVIQSQLVSTSYSLWLATVKVSVVPSLPMVGTTSGDTTRSVCFIWKTGTVNCTTLFSEVKNTPAPRGRSSDAGSTVRANGRRAVAAARGRDVHPAALGLGRPARVGRDGEIGRESLPGCDDRLFGGFEGRDGARVLGAFVGTAAPVSQTEQGNAQYV